MIALVVLAACLDRLYDAPYLLATGLPPVRSLTFDREGALLAGTADGLYRVEPDGRATRIAEGPVDAVTVGGAATWVLAAGEVRGPGGRVPVPGAVDLAAAWDDRVWVLTATGVSAVDPATGAVAPVVDGLPGARALALGPSPTMLVLGADTLHAVEPDGRRRTLVGGLVDARAVAADARGRLWVIQGEPSELYRIEGDGPARLARFLDSPTDLQFAVGARFPPGTAYLASAAGRVDYVPFPP